MPEAAADFSKIDCLLLLSTTVTEFVVFLLNESSAICMRLRRITSVMSICSTPLSVTTARMFCLSKINNHLTYRPGSIECCPAAASPWRRNANPNWISLEKHENGERDNGWDENCRRDAESQFRYKTVGKMRFMVLNVMASVWRSRGVASIEHEYFDHNFYWNFQSASRASFWAVRAPRDS